MRDYPKYHDDLLEANKTLSERLSKSENEKDKMFFELDNLRHRCKELEEAYHDKMRVARIIVKSDDINYVLQVLKEHQTPEGLFIEGRI